MSFWDWSVEEISAFAAIISGFVAIISMIYSRKAINIAKNAVNIEKAAHSIPYLDAIVSDWSALECEIVEDEVRQIKAQFSSSEGLQAAKAELDYVCQQHAKVLRFALDYKPFIERFINPPELDYISERQLLRDPFRDENSRKSYLAEDVKSMDDVERELSEMRRRHKQVSHMISVLPWARLQTLHRVIS